MAKKILLIDDEKELVQVMRKQVQNAGYEVHVAYDGQQGLEMARQVHPHLVLTDLSMPVMDGLTFCNELKSGAGTGHIPVIMVSAFARQEEEMQRAGVKDYLMKPFDRQTLIDKVNAFFNAQRALKILIATKMVHLMKVIVDQNTLKLDIHLTNDQSAIADEAMALSPDLILMDVDMFTAFSAPGTVRYLRQKAGLKEKPVLLMRGMNVIPDLNEGNDQIVEECLAAGASHYVGQSNQQSFIAVIKEYCRY
jgi:CheY-like chemotaxis protein